jgi:hypothetical protein
MGSGVDKLAPARISDFVNLSSMTKNPENLPSSFRRSSIPMSDLFLGHGIKPRSSTVAVWRDESAVDVDRVDGARSELLSITSDTKYPLRAMI